MECKWEQSWILMTDTRTHTADLSRRIQVVVSSSNKLIIACRLIPNLSSHTVSNTDKVVNSYVVTSVSLSMKTDYI